MVVVGLIVRMVSCAASRSVSAHWWAVPPVTVIYLLLDVGPNALGVIPEHQSARLKEIGHWLKKYGESIYATRGGPYKNGTWGGSTFKDRKIYLHVSQWEGDNLRLPPLKAKVLSCRNLSNRSDKPAFVQDNDAITITLAASKQDSTDTIIVLEMSGPVSNEFCNGPVTKD
ncbi:MAG: Alpha-L-fucosidase [Sphingobacterium sp.]|nr:Alpha-L-fucosidase [Sphingobacterium sp.]